MEKYVYAHKTANATAQVNKKEDEVGQNAEDHKRSQNLSEMQKF